MMLRLGLDAANLSAGGGVTHLVGLLSALDPREFGIDRVRVWTGTATAAQLPGREWLEVETPRALDAPLPFRVAWQQGVLPELMTGLDLLFVPGCGHVRCGRPVVTMPQNMLPFQPRELLRYGASFTTARLLVLRRVQTRSLQRAQAVIFLSEYARRGVGAFAGKLPRTALIPHGVGEAFRCAPRPQQPLQSYSEQRPFTLLYVSSIEPYKHQDRVAEAVLRLAGQGLPVKLRLVGGGDARTLARLTKRIGRHPQGRQRVELVGAVAHAELAAEYHRADGFVFASTCENLPNTLLEAMAAGLPIAASRSGPMPEILGEGGLYFDPLAPGELERALGNMLSDPDTRGEKAKLAHQAAASYSWQRCARDTWRLLAEVAGG